MVQKLENYQYHCIETCKITEINNVSMYGLCMCFTSYDLHVIAQFKNEVVITLAKIIQAQVYLQSVKKQNKNYLIAPVSQSSPYLRILIYFGVYIYVRSSVRWHPFTRSSSVFLHLHTSSYSAHESVHLYRQYSRCAA